VSSGDVLDAIDGAILAWETSGDAMRWVPSEQREPQPCGAPTYLYAGHGNQIVMDHWDPPIDGQLVRQAFENLVAAMRDMVESVGQLDLSAVGRFASGGFVAPPDDVEPDVDVRQRALDAVRNRNTGPAIRRRAPRELGLGRRRS
jgi:hypothetical protein